MGGPDHRQQPFHLASVHIPEKKTSIPLNRMRLLLLSGLFVVAALPAQITPAPASPGELIENAVEHQWTDENQTDQFTYLELWHNRNFDKHGGLLVDETAKFESVSLHGKPYLRMIEQNGKPLQDKDADDEGHNYDSAIAAGRGMSMQERVAAIAARNVGFHLHLEMLPVYFYSTVVGTEVVNGRPAVHLDCTPRNDMKPKEKEEAWGMQFHLQVWIDQRDHAFARVDAELLHKRDGMLPGTTATLTWAPVDGVWLPARTDMHGHAALKRNAITFDTEYTYSNYRKFRTDIRILNSPSATEDDPRPDKE
jgi:hypothetical protein